MTVNVGNQTVSILFHTVANSSQWNKRSLNVRSLGVYIGGWLAKVNNTTASISALVCEITDGLYQVRVSTAVTVNISVPDSSTPYIVLRWTYGGTINDYMEILAVTTPAANDLIVGLCTFTGGGALDDFNYTDRSNPSTKDLFLKVEPTGNADSKVRVRGGYFQTSTSSVQILDQKSDVIGPPASNSQVYLVYVDTAGAVKIDSSGIPAVNPSAPSYTGKLVLAEVTVASTDVTITQDMIKDVRPFITNGQITADGSTLEINSSGQLQVKGGGINQAQLGTITSVFGAWTNKDSSNNNLASGFVYRPGSDGLVIVLGSTDGSNIAGYTDGSNPPTTLRLFDTVHAGGSYGTVSITLPVRKNDYFKIVGGISAIHWLPVGNGQCVKQ